MARNFGYCYYYYYYFLGPLAQSRRRKYWS